MLEPLYTSELATASSPYLSQYLLFSIHAAAAPVAALFTSRLGHHERSHGPAASRLSAHIHLPKAQLRLHTPLLPILPYSALPTLALQSKPSKKLLLPSSLISTDFLHMSVGFFKLLLHPQT